MLKRSLTLLLVMGALLSMASPAAAERVSISVNYDLGEYNCIVYGKPVKIRATITGGKPPYEIIFAEWASGSAGEAITLQPGDEENVYTGTYVFKEGGFAQPGKFVQFNLRVADAEDALGDYGTPIRENIKVADGPFYTSSDDKQGTSIVREYDVKGRLLEVTTTHYDPNADYWKVIDRVYESYDTQGNWLKTMKTLGEYNIVAYQSEPYTDSRGYSGIYTRDFTPDNPHPPYHFAYKDASGNQVDEYHSGCIFEKGPLVEKCYTDAKGRQVTDTYDEDGAFVRTYQDAAGHAVTEYYDKNGDPYIPDSRLPGDANMDHVLDIHDLEAIIDYLVQGHFSGRFSLSNADTDKKDDVDIKDALWIIGQIVN